MGVLPLGPHTYNSIFLKYIVCVYESKIICITEQYK
jgi:hypothetical protein